MKIRHLTGDTRREARRHFGGRCGFSCGWCASEALKISRKLQRKRAGHVMIPEPAPPSATMLRARQQARDYMKEHPDAKDGVMKAVYAYQLGHPRVEYPLRAHYFLSGVRTSECHWCGRSREMVRWDDLPKECANWREPLDIKEVLAREAKVYLALLAKAEHHIPQLIAKLGLSGETLAVLHHTHGYDIEVVQAIMDVSPGLLADYTEAMEIERTRSRASQKRDIITAKHI